MYKLDMNQKVIDVIKKINGKIKNEKCDVYQLFKKYDE